MIIDKHNHFNYPKQTVTATTASTDSIDLKGAGAAYGQANFLVSRVATSFTAAGSATLNIQLQTSDNEMFTNPVVVYDSNPISKGKLIENTFVQKASLSGLEFKRYIRVNYVVTNGPMTAGSIETFVTPDIEV